MYIPTLITPLLLLFPLVSAIDILLPLYLYPSDAATAWSPIFQTIATHPTTTFQIVINPNSGPGTPSLLTDPNLITGISKLNAYPNVRTLGYVLTGYGHRATATVTADVDIYAGWSAYSDADIHLDGIYFDEVSNDATQANYDRMAYFSRHARDSIRGATVVFNPGYRAPEPLFASCDLMVEFEHPLADYEAEGVLAQIPPAFASKSAVQILETPTTAGTTDVGRLVAAMEQRGLGAFFFGTDCCYKVWDRGLLEAMADAAA